MSCGNLNNHETKIINIKTIIGNYPRLLLTKNNTLLLITGGTHTDANHIYNCEDLIHQKNIYINMVSL